jgi:regulator of RNase E activity RraA
MATISKGLGAVGCVSDGGLRDVMEVRALGDFHYFCPHLVVSHGWPVILEVNVPVQIHGLDIRPGDLLHGDGNGLLGIPADVVDALPAACQSVRDDEAEILRLARQPGFSLDDLRQWQSVKH